MWEDIKIEFQVINRKLDMIFQREKPWAKNQKMTPFEVKNVLRWLKETEK